MSESSVSVSDEEIGLAVKEWLASVDYNTVTMNGLRAQMEAKFSISLTDRKAVLKASLGEFIDSQIAAEEDGGAEEDGADEDEKESIINDEGGDSDEAEEDDTRDTAVVKKERKAGGFNTPVQLSTELSNFFDGAVTMPRTAVTKGIWAYIKEQNLQNPLDKREILCDEKLEQLFKRKKFGMFKLAKFLSPMMKVVAELQNGDSKKLKEKAKLKSAREKAKGKTQESGNKVKADGDKKRKAGVLSKSAKKRLKLEKKSEDGDEAVEKKARPINKDNPFHAPYRLSPKLAQFIGVEEETRPQVVKKLWEHIHAHNLQNPANKKEILLDAAMKEVFEVDTFTMFSMHKYLKDHLESIKK